MSAEKKIEEKSVCGLKKNSHFCIHEENIFLTLFGREELYSEEYLTWMNDPDVTKTLGRFDYLLPVNREKLVEYFDGLDSANTIFLAIYMKISSDNKKKIVEEEKFIGTLKIYDIDLYAKRAAIGIAIGDKREWGKGYASRAIRAACRYIFNVLGLRKITAGYIGDNVAMECAFLKNGFQIEAVFREHIYFDGRYVDHKFVCKFRDDNEETTLA